YGVILNARETDRIRDYFLEEFLEITPGFEGKGPEAFLKRNEDFFANAGAAIEMVKIFADTKQPRVGVYAKARSKGKTLFRIAGFFEIKDGKILSHKSLHQQ
ncbi:MAG: nuclear transport factor 2 family protein, partial [Lachnospiraceae bacterium]|nr:nuclear transport factor 2 family protein [Lachnospiraceae bacterium]